jgi:hypothetical protein
LRGSIEKIETFGVKLKIVDNFGGGGCNCNFPLIFFFFFFQNATIPSLKYKNKKLRGGRPPQLGLEVALATSGQPPLIFIFYFFNLEWRHFGKKKKMSEWSNCKNLEVWGGCIAKIEILEVELKIAPNFKG